MHPGDVVAIENLIRTRISQHEHAMRSFGTPQMQQLFSDEQRREFVAVEHERWRYYTGLLDRFQHGPNSGIGGQSARPG